LFQEVVFACVVPCRNPHFLWQIKNTRLPFGAKIGLVSHTFLSGGNRTFLLLPAKGR
jgi:hypothetical protein